MKAVEVVDCTQQCVDELTVCVTESHNTWAQCMQELRDGAGRLGDACGNKQCAETPEMTALKTLASSPPPPSRDASLCSVNCEKEFVVCCDEGPGYAKCVEEIRGSTGPLGELCDATCTLSDKMVQQDHVRCRTRCEKEFNICVNDGGIGYDACVQELTDFPEGSPLTKVCVEGCEMTASMLAQNDATSAACSEDCRDEFKICASEGPGAVTCAYEIRTGIGPLADKCDTNCKISTAMMAYVAPSPPPFPPVHECSASCETEFRVCVTHNEGGCNACTQELSEFPDDSPLVEAGCSRNCQLTATMNEWCGQ